MAVEPLVVWNGTLHAPGGRYLVAEEEIRREGVPEPPRAGAGAYELHLRQMRRGGGLYREHEPE